MWSDNETNRDFLNFTGVSETVAELVVQTDGRPISIGVSGALSAPILGPSIRTLRQPRIGHAFGQGRTEQAIFRYDSMRWRSPKSAK